MLLVKALQEIQKLGGRFGYFLIFRFRVGKREEGSEQVAGVGFSLKMGGGGGYARRLGGRTGAARMSAGGGWGELDIFFRGAETPAKKNS